MDVSVRDRRAVERVTPVEVIAGLGEMRKAEPAPDSPDRIDEAHTGQDSERRRQDRTNDDEAVGRQQLAQALHSSHPTIAPGDVRVDAGTEIDRVERFGARG